MPTTLTFTATVQPGGRLEITAPTLPEGRQVEVRVIVPEPKPPQSAADFLAYLDSLPPRPRSYKTVEELDRAFQEERDSWDR